MKPRTLFVILGAVLVLAACGAEAWEQDPAVQAVKKACRSLDEEDEYTCVERHAVESLNPDVCRLAGIWIDDMCLQAVYEAANDPAICERLYLEGVRPNCRTYYAEFITPPPGFTVFRSDQLPMEVALPPGWASAEGPKDLLPPLTGAVGFNSWGEADFWASALTGADGSSTYWYLEALAQVPSGEAYVVLIADYQYASRVQEYGPEHESRELTSLWEPKDCRNAGGARWVAFLKWGRLFRLEVYCPADVSDETAATVDSLIASWRFDQVLAGDPGWASVRARSQLPAEAHPEWFPVLSGAPGDQASRYAVWKRGIARRITKAQMQGDIVSVTFMLARDDSAQGVDDTCPLDRCHWWRFEARPNGEVELMEQGGADLSLLPLKGTFLTYRDPGMGFAAEVPADWEISDHAETAGVLGRPWIYIEFRSELYPYGHEAFNQYKISVLGAPSLGGTLTETVELSLSPLISDYRDLVQMHCCLTVGGEPAMELLNYPPTRWGNRQIAVLHEGWEYRLNFYPLTGLTTATPAGVEAQIAFDTFLHTFSFIPFSATPAVPAPTLTPAPTPTNPPAPAI